MNDEELLKLLEEKIKIAAEISDKRHDTRIFFKQKEFIRILDILLPQFERGPYGGIMSSLEAAKEGYDNFCYRGFVVCLDD